MPTSAVTDTPPIAAAAERTRLMLAFADAIEEHADELAELESLDNGKPLASAKGDIAASVSHLRYYAGWPTKIEGETIPIDPTSQGAVCPETITLRLMASLSELRSDLKGDDTPGRERDGVTALGEKLVDQLRKIGGPG